MPFDQATEPRLSYPQRFKQLAYRQFWLRDIQGSGYQARINNMVKEWHLLGIVVEQPGDLPMEPEPGFPARYWVETDRSTQFSDADPSWRQLLMVEGLEEEERRTDLLRKAATPLPALAAERHEEPAAVVHPRRRNIRRDER